MLTPTQISAAYAIQQDIALVLGCHPSAILPAIRDLRVDLARFETEALDTAYRFSKVQEENETLLARIAELEDEVDRLGHDIQDMRD